MKAVDCMHPSLLLREVAANTSRIVYHLQLKQFSSVVSLPHAAMKLFGEKETIAIIFQTSLFRCPLHVWSWPTGLHGLTMPDQTAAGYIRDANFFFAGVIFHPTDSSVLYLVVFDPLPAASAGPDAKIVTSVHKFESRNHTRSFYYTTPVPAGVGCSNFTPRYRLVNYGNYNLFLLFPPEDFTDFFASQINFNVLTETFSKGTHVLNTGMRRPIWALDEIEGNAHSTEARFRGHAWNDQLYYLQVPSFRQKDSSRPFLFHWTHSRDTAHCIADKDRTLVADWRDTASNCAENFNTPIDHIADDHFVIVVRNGGYVAYNYDNPELVGDAWKRRPEDASFDIFYDGNTTCPIKGCSNTQNGASGLMGCFICNSQE